MPIYEYICQACTKEHEAIQKFSDQPLVDCPHCHEPALIKKLSAPAFHLKGTGWYVTDFKGTPAKPAEKSQEKTQDTVKEATPAACPATCAKETASTSSTQE